MAFSYSGNPNASAKDRIRFELSDTNAASAEFQDEEILAALYPGGPATTEVPWPVAASALARVIHRRYTRQADFKVGAISFDYQERAKAWGELADRLEELSPGGYGAAPPDALASSSFGSIFALGMHDSSGASSSYPPAGSRYTA